MVGDTTSDTGMAKNAGAGFCIGVLTGSGTKEQLLQSGADIILPDVGYIPYFLCQHDIIEANDRGLYLPREKVLVAAVKV